MELSELTGKGITLMNKDLLYLGEGKLDSHLPPKFHRRACLGKIQYSPCIRDVEESQSLAQADEMGRYIEL